jgi:hypothetical protein
LLEVQASEPQGHEGGGFGGWLIDDHVLGAGKELFGLTQTPCPDQRGDTHIKQGPQHPWFAGRRYRSAAAV